MYLPPFRLMRIQCYAVCIKEKEVYRDEEYLE